MKGSQLARLNGRPGGIRTPDPRFRKHSHHRSPCSEPRLFSRIQWLAFGPDPTVRARICTPLCTPRSAAANHDQRFSSASDCLRLFAPIISISKRRLRQLDAIELVRKQREKRQQPLAFHTRPFVLCGLPLRRPSKSQLIHVRHSGGFFLHVTAHPDFGLPYGQDRLIPIWVATLALQQKNRTIHFDSAAQMLDFFRLPKDGPYYRRLVGGFQRIFTATIFFGTDERPSGAMLIDFSRFHFFDHMRLWFNTDSTAHDGRKFRLRCPQILLVRKRRLLKNRG